MKHFLLQLKGDYGLIPKDNTMVVSYIWAVCICATDPAVGRVCVAESNLHSGENKLGTRLPVVEGVKGRNA